MSKTRQDIAVPLRQRPQLEPLELGPFDLFDALGEGAMGQVWRGRHREQGIPVAIKMVTEPTAQHKSYRRRLRDEVRAAASLNHPGVVDVFDYGEIPAAIEEATYGGIAESTPYFVMEMCARGSLAEHRRPRSWSELRTILLSLLDALAHAHARGIIHRDIKPANVLLSPPTRRWSGVKLGDFGLSYIADWQSQDEQLFADACGTPGYAAPEQLTGRWRDIGPWSDLYALGCLSWQLACGQPPFRGRGLLEVSRQQLYAPLPAFEPDFPVAKRFEAWVHRLLQRDPTRRYRHAADAAWALVCMSAPEASPVRPDAPGEAGATVPVAADSASLIFGSFVERRTGSGLAALDPATQPLAAAPGDEVHPVSGEHADAQSEAGALAITTAPVPRDWASWAEPHPSKHLQGAGLRLYGLRRMPLYARHEERDQLWDLLMSVLDERRPQVVLIEGPAGAGKSYLAGWLCERAAEIGAAQLLRATHNPGCGTADGLTRMLQSYFRSAGLAHDALTARIAAWLDPRRADEAPRARALAGLLAAEDVEDAPTTLRARHDVITDALVHIVDERAAVLWADDLQWSSDSLSLITALLDDARADDLPVLIIGTVRTDTTGDDPEASALLDALTEHDRTTQITLEPLALNARAELIEHLLHLEPALARRVAQRTHGNPLFAVQLIGDWIERGVLATTADGFSLRDGEELEIPDDLFSLWMSRLEGVLGAESDPLWSALELGAALGVEWLDEEWRACCAAAGCAVDARRLEALLENHLLETTDGGYRLAHSMLRESLERHARNRGRWAEHNRVCAEVLASSPRRGGEATERLGRHYAAAEQWRECLEPLLAAIKWRGNRRQTLAAEFLLDLRAQAIEALGLPEHDRARAQNMMIRALNRAHRDQLSSARQFAERALEAVGPSDDPDLLARAYFRLGQVYQLGGQINEALAHFEHASEQLESSEELSRSRFAAGVSFGLGELMLRRGDASAALAHFEQLRDGPYGHTAFARANITRVIGNCQRALGRFEQACRSVEQALAVYEAGGNHEHVIACYNLLGDIHRQAGDFDAAEDYYRRAVAASRSGHPREHLASVLNVGLLEVARRRFDRAYRRLVELLDEFEDRGIQMLALYTRCGLLACLAHRREFERLDGMLSQVSEQVEHHGISDPEFALLAEIAAEVAEAAGEEQLAQALEAFVRLQRE